jgi:hypothetical protein
MIDLRFWGEGSARAQTDNEIVRDHLNLLCESNRDGRDTGSPFGNMEAARIRFLRRLYLDGKLTEWPDGR